MSALSWIIKEAKRLRRKYPHRFDKKKNAWRDGYVAEASAIYARKHKGKSPVGKKKKRRVGKVRRKAKVVKRVTHRRRVKAHKKKVRTRYVVKHVVRRIGQTNGGSSMKKAMPYLVLGGIGLVAFALLKKQAAPATQPLPPLAQTANPYRNTATQNILAYATAGGLALDAIAKLIRALNNAPDEDINTVKRSIDAGTGIPYDFI